MGLVKPFFVRAFQLRADGCNPCSACLLACYGEEVSLSRIFNGLCVPSRASSTSKVSLKSYGHTILILRATITPSTRCWWPQKSCC